MNKAEISYELMLRNAATGFGVQHFQYNMQVRPALQVGVGTAPGRQSYVCFSMTRCFSSRFRFLDFFSFATLLFCFLIYFSDPLARLQTDSQCHPKNEKVQKRTRQNPRTRMQKQKLRENCNTATLSYSTPS